MSKNTKKIIVVVVVVLLCVGGAFALTSGNSEAPSDEESSHHEEAHKSSETKSSSNDNAQSSTPEATNSVEIKDYAYAPVSITVKVGTKVTWTNQDSVRHDVVDDNNDSNGPSSNLLAKDESYSFTFTKAGTYKYHCTPHPYMKGTVIVTE